MIEKAKLNIEMINNLMYPFKEIILAAGRYEEHLQIENENPQGHTHDHSHS